MTRKKRPKKRAQPPIAKYAIGSRSRRLDVLEGTRRPTRPRVLQSGVVRIRNARRMSSARFRRGRALRSERTPRCVLRLADEQHAGAGDSDEAEGDHGEGDRTERLREGAAQHRPDDEPRSEDDRVDAERGAGHSVLDDVPQVGEGGGRERPGAGGEDDDQGPSRDQLFQVRTAGARREREENREPAEAREPQGHERPSQSCAVGQPAAHREREAKRNAERRDDDQELIGRRGPRVYGPEQIVREREDVSIERDDREVDREKPPTVLVPPHGAQEGALPPTPVRRDGG